MMKVPILQPISLKYYYFSSDDLKLQNFGKHVLSLLVTSINITRLLGVSQKKENAHKRQELRGGPLALLRIVEYQVILLLKI